MFSWPVLIISTVKLANLVGKDQGSKQKLSLSFEEVIEKGR